MYDNLTGLQNLMFFGAVFGVDKSGCMQRAGVLLERLNLSDAADRKLGTYSTGMRQRLSLARALIHRPKILFLDEPTSGLDPESAKSVNDLIKQLAQKEGTTVFLCTHQLRYAEEICTQYGLVDNGALLKAGTLTELRGSVSSDYTLTVKAEPLLQWLTQAENGNASLHVDSEEEIPAIAKRIVDSGARLYHISARQPTLEEIYFTLIEQRGKAGTEQ
jgi:ABC-2 type transport system ATP-binding protein